MRKIFVICSVSATLLCLSLSLLSPYLILLYVPIVPIIVIGIGDMFQTKHTIRRNFPVLGRFRYLLESIRPELNQYFIESNSDGVPFSREMRSVVYQRAKRELDTLPFGTQKNVYDIGYEWVTHSLSPKHVNPTTLRLKIGGPDCKQPYSASIFNVSAMSFGSLSKSAVRALNKGALLGSFYQNTGEGGLTPYHLENGGDIVWQIGTGYFSCRTEDGNFCETKFQEKANLPQIKMIEIKLSQGAKPSHGGILPAKKVTKEISEIRGVPMGKDVLSPPAHTSFSNPMELMGFITKLRKLSNGKPIGFKLSVGKKSEFIAICKAMLKTGVTPDFITVDGGEGGTGAAPIEFSNYVGYPLKEALLFVHNSLVGFELRDKIKIIAAGKVVTAFDVVSKMALGADICNSARAMMMALGCIQALRCNSNDCPTGVATQKESLVAGLDVNDKSVRVFQFHSETVKGVAELIGAMGLTSTSQIPASLFHRRTGSTETKSFTEIYEYIPKGSLLNKPYPFSFTREMMESDPETFMDKINLTAA